MFLTCHSSDFIGYHTAVKVCFLLIVKF